MPAASSSPEVSRLLDHLFRREFGRLVAILTRQFGVEHLHLAEDVVQDALVRAMQAWPYSGVPQNPTAWLLQTAKNRALDHTRRRTLWRGRQSKLIPLVEDCLHSALTASPPQFEDEIRDSQLRMMFVCGHPGLPVEAQVALTLKTLCGFGEREIAAAFLASEAAVTKRIVRARQFLREHGVAVEMPLAAELASRVEMVLQALYLLFNEGYKASHGDSLLRLDLCQEAIRLTELLAAHPVGQRPVTDALLALMYLNAARLPARTDGEGALLLLAEQDRSRWNRSQVAIGLRHLASSGAGPSVTRYHLEAGIASCHCLAPSFAETDWAQIVSLYDLLLEQDGSPIVALNRAVAVAYASGQRAGLDAIDRIKDRTALENYHLLHAVSGQLWFDAGDQARAASSFRRALELATLPAERVLLEKRLAQCRGSIRG
ncbi:MAG: polymerase sigma factor [Verrucomicrobia bacterium]|nr:polymerase sigma factor [Verrucomicrobiota bacterium]